MALLDLPPEILQLILLHTTTPSFLQLIASCWAMYNIAGRCREALLHHLLALPGIKLGLEDLDTLELFNMLRHRAAMHLYGAALSTDQTLYSFRAVEGGHGRGDTVENGSKDFRPGIVAAQHPNIAQIDVKASAMAGCTSPNVALIYKGSPIVHLFDTQSNEMRPVRTLIPPHQPLSSVEALKVAFGPVNTISVIYRYTPSLLDDHDRPVHEPKINEPDIVFFPGVHIVHYHERQLGSPCTLASLDLSLDIHPTALAVSSRLRIAVSWTSRGLGKNPNYVALYTAGAEPSFPKDWSPELGCSVLSYDGHTLLSPTVLSTTSLPSLTNQPPLQHINIVSLLFGHGGTQVYYATAGSLINNFYQDLQPSMPNSGHPPLDPVPSEMFRRFEIIPWNEHATSADLNIRLYYYDFAISFPFYGVHSSFADTASTTRYCSRRYLALGVTSNKVQGWTVRCLLRLYTEGPYAGCNHLVHLDRQPRGGPNRQSKWHVVARLWGYRPQSTSLGGVWAASEGGSRIAIADWDKILVWALSPRDLADESQDGAERFYEADMCDEGEGDTKIVLKPIVLRAADVVHGLVFVGAGEDELLALTGRGIHRFNLNPRTTSGEKTTQVIPVPSPILFSEEADDMELEAGKKRKNATARSVKPARAAEYRERKKVVVVVDEVDRTSSPPPLTHMRRRTRGRRDRQHDLYGA